MNIRQKKIITTAAGIANIAFTIAVSATATFAWFYNSPATAQGISVQCAIPDSRLSWEILKYDDDLKAGVSSTKTEDFYLEQYDEYISQRNIHSNVILRATMTYGDNELFDNNKQLYVDISCLDNPVLTDSKVNKFTSNVCQFKATVVNYVTNDGNTVVVNEAIDELSADTKYTTATSFFANSTSSTSFLTVNNDTPNKDRDNKIAIIPYFDCGHDLVKQMTVYVECSYKDKLVKYYRSTWGMSETGEIKLKGDINDFNFRVGEKYNGSYVQVRNSSEITSGDYMITYDNYSAAMDGSLGPESKGNMKMDQASNYIPVEPRKGRIRNNETNYNSRFNYNGEYLKSASGYNIGRTSNTTNGLNVNNLTANKANLTYDTKSHVYGSADPKPELKFNTTKNVTRFNFYTSETASSQQDITLYKYNENASYDVHLVSIAVSGQRESFPINSAFEFGGVITATYSDGTTSPINSTLCTFTGFDLSADIPTQRVTVTYEEEGYVASTSYQISITKEPYIKLDYTRLVGVSGSSYTITASYYFLASEPTYTWTVEDANIATIAPTNNTVRVTLNNIGTTTISCSATGVNNPVICSVTVSAPTSAYKLVTDDTKLKAGDKIVIAETSKGVLAGTISGDYLTSIEGEFNNNTVTWTGNAVYEFTLGGSAGSWTLANSDGKLLGATAAKKVKFGEGTTTWSITIENNNATIQNNNATIEQENPDYGRFLYNVAFPRFTTYTSAAASDMLLPQIYRLETGLSALKEKIGIEVSTSKTQYFTDDDFVEPTVTVKYSDATSEVINTGYTIDSRDLSTPGKKTITVTYSVFNDSYDIYITKSTLTGISVTPHKTNYYVGENFSSEDVTVIASYSSTKQKEVTPTSVSGFNNKASGTQKIKITYTEGDISFSETYEITMNPVVLTSIEITKNPTKMTYNVKDNFDISGMVITAHYDNNSTKEVQNEVTYETTLSNSSINSINFTYEENGVEKTVTLTGIVVNQATLTPSQTSIEGTATNEITNLSVAPDHFSGEVIYEWTSEDETVASITNNETTNKPTITLNKVGTTTLTCYATDGAQDASTTINVTVNDSSISLDKTTLNITEGNKATIIATIEGTGNPTWTSSNTNVATITYDGKTCTVTGVAAGNATITATFNDKQATCQVTVTGVSKPTITSWQKITSIGDLTDGDYLIVYEGGNVAFNGGLDTLDAVGNKISVTIDNNTIAYNNTTESAKFTIAPMSEGEGYSIQSASGQYIFRSSNSNGLDSNNVEQANTISFNNDGSVNIVSGGAYLRYNSTANQTRFRYFKSSSYANQKAIQLYKGITSVSKSSLSIFNNGVPSLTNTNVKENINNNIVMYQRNLYVETNNQNKPIIKGNNNNVLLSMIIDDCSVKYALNNGMKVILLDECGNEIAIVNAKTMIQVSSNGERLLTVMIPPINKDIFNIRILNSYGSGQYLMISNMQIK